MINPWKEIKQPVKDVSARRIDHNHPLDLYWAKNHFGNYMFIYEFIDSDLSKKLKFPNLTGIKIILIQNNSMSNKNRILLILNEQSNWEIFFTLCNDLVSVTKNLLNEPTSLKVIVRRLSRWQEFLKRHKEGILSEEKIKGLIGELFFLQNHIAPNFGIEQAITFWQGPKGAPQDYNINDMAIEVKCQNGSSNPKVKINSFEQLSPQLPNMYLYVITLGKSHEENKESINLPKIINEITNELLKNNSEEIEKFNDLIFMSGYADSKAYLDYSYIFVSDCIYKVKDNFPRIKAKNVMTGISNVTYYIDISACEPFEEKPDWMKG